MENKSIKFDGAGWEKADSCGDVGNCRIRGMIDTIYGPAYIEMSSVEVTKYSYEYFKKQYGLGNLVGTLTDFFLLKDERTNFSKELMPFFKERGNNPSFKWTQKNLIDFLNSLPIGDNKVESIVVDNDYHVFTDKKYLSAILRKEVA